MNKKSFQLFVEKFEDIDINDYSRYLCKAISLVVLDNPQYEATYEYKRLLYIKDNTNSELQIPLHMLDSYVNPSKDTLNTQLFVIQEFCKNDGTLVNLSGIQIEQELYNAVIEITLIVSQLIRKYNFISSSQHATTNRQSLPYPTL